MERLGAVSSVLWLVAVGSLAAGLGAAWFVGWELDVVTTGSMAPELGKGTLAVVAPVRPSAIEVGDVVTYRSPSSGSGGTGDRRILHRVVEVVAGADGPLLRTQGDANATPDPVLVPARGIEGRLLHAVPRAGVLVEVLQPPFGLIVLVGVPALIFVAGLLRKVVGAGRLPDHHLGSRPEHLAS